MSGLERSDVVILNTEYKSHTRVKHNKRKEVRKCQNAVIERVSGGGVTCSPLITRVLDNLNKIRGRKAPAFTLTEVLLAVLIVGVIAALVLPAVVTKYQDKTFESAFNREVHSLQDSID